MTLVVLAAVIIMSFYFEISIKKSVIFALLYQGLSIIVDYIAYISNNTIISKAGEVQKGYALIRKYTNIFITANPKEIEYKTFACTSFFVY